LTVQAEQSSHRHKGHSHSSRKDARKQERMDRKKRKVDHFSQTPHSVKRKTEQEHVEQPQRKRVKISQESGSRLPASKSHHAATTTTTTTTTKILSRKPDEPRTTESVPKQKRGTTRYRGLSINRQLNLLKKLHRRALGLAKKKKMHTSHTLNPSLGIAVVTRAARMMTWMD